MTKQRKVYSAKVEDKGNIWERGVLLNFQSKYWTASIKVPKDKLKNLPTSVRGMQSLLHDRGPYDEIVNVYSRAHKFIKSQTLDFPIKSLNFVDKDRIEYIDAALNEFTEELNEKVEAFASIYNQLIKDTRKELQNQAKKRNFNWQDFFDENKYPKDIRNKWGFSWNYFSIGVGDALKEISPKLYKEKVEAFKKQWEEFEQLTFDTAKEILLKKVQSIADGNNSVVALENALQKWDELWSGYIGEKQFKKVVKDLKKASKGMSAERLRNNEDYKKEVTDSFQKLAKSLDGIDFKPKRAIKF